MFQYFTHVKKLGMFAGTLILTGILQMLQGTVSRVMYASARGRISKVPLQKTPIISVPFQRIGVNPIGPIIPAASSGKRYITVVDYATRYPEAVASYSLDKNSFVFLSKLYCSTVLYINKWIHFMPLHFLCKLQFIQMLSEDRHTEYMWFSLKRH